MYVLHNSNFHGKWMKFQCRMIAQIMSATAIASCIVIDDEFMVTHINVIYSVTPKPGKPVCEKYWECIKVQLIF